MRDGGVGLHYLLLATVIDPISPLRKGDVIACHFESQQSVMFWMWYGPTGRDGNGRFVKKGSPDEAFETSGLTYTANHIREGHFTILGKVYAAHGPAERITPPTAS